MTPRVPLADIAVLGGGQVALLAACALRRTLPTARVRVLTTPVLPQAFADHAHGTLPLIARLHDRIGIDEAGLVERAGASHRLATRHVGAWRDDGSEWWIGHGATAGAAADGWTGWSDAGAVASGPAVALARAERFAAASDDRTSPLSDIDHGLRWAPDAYRRRLGSLARHLGVTIAQAEADADPVTIDADLVIDASGVPRGDRVDWSRDLPIDRVATVLAPPALSVVDTVELSGDAIRLTAPGRDATRITTMRRGGEGIAFSSGRRCEAWCGRVMTIGDGAASLPPLGQANLALAALAIELLVELLPGRDIHPLERAEWNRRMALTADAMCDFVAGHLAGLPGQHPLKAVPSPMLARRMTEFARRGRIPFVEQDPVSRDLWTQLLGGIGIPPGVPARSVALDRRAIAAARATHDRRIAQAVALARPYPLWLEQMVGERR